MPKPYPKELRDDVVAVARTGETSLKQIAKDFELSEGCLHSGMKAADVGTASVLPHRRRPGPTCGRR